MVERDRGMDVYIVRHAKAERATGGMTDADRPLRPKGWRQAAWLGEALSRGGVEIERMVSSPLRRAQETAGVLSRALNRPVETDAALAVGRPVRDAMALVERATGAGAIMVVGHNPQLEELVWELTGQALELRTGEAVQVRVEAGQGLVVARWRADEP